MINNLNVHKKLIGLLNVNGFFDGLLSFINYSCEKGFISKRAKRIIVVATTSEELIEKLIAFVLKSSSCQYYLDGRFHCAKMQNRCISFPLISQFIPLVVLLFSGCKSRENDGILRSFFSIS
ncbi:hypothetical protein OROMI_009273 [Orobanche minor]